MGKGNLDEYTLTAMLKSLNLIYCLKIIGISVYQVSRRFIIVFLAGNRTADWKLYKTKIITERFSSSEERSGKIVDILH